MTTKITTKEELQGILKTHTGSDKVSRVFKGWADILFYNNKPSRRKSVQPLLEYKAYSRGKSTIIFSRDINNDNAIFFVDSFPKVTRSACRTGVDLHLINILLPYMQRGAILTACWSSSLRLEFPYPCANLPENEIIELFKEGFVEYQPIDPSYKDGPSVIMR